MKKSKKELAICFLLSCAHSHTHLTLNTQTHTLSLSSKVKRQAVAGRQAHHLENAFARDRFDSQDAKEAQHGGARVEEFGVVDKAKLGGGKRGGDGGLGDALEGGGREGARVSASVVWWLVEGERIAAAAGRMRCACENWSPTHAKRRGAGGGAAREAVSPTRTATQRSSALPLSPTHTPWAASAPGRARRRRCAARRRGGAGR